MVKQVMGIQIGDREKDAAKVQELLTKYGCIIKTRLGLHETDNICSSNGLIILEFQNGSYEKANELKVELEELESIKTRMMEF